MLRRLLGTCRRHHRRGALDGPGRLTGTNQISTLALHIGTPIRRRTDRRPRHVTRHGYSSITMARRLSRHWDVCHHRPGVVRAAASPRRCISRRESVVDAMVEGETGPAQGLPTMTARGGTADRLAVHCACRCVPKRPCRPSSPARQPAFATDEHLDARLSAVHILFLIFVRFNAGPGSGSSRRTLVSSSPKSSTRSGAMGSRGITTSKPAVSRGPFPS